MRQSIVRFSLPAGSSPHRSLAGYVTSTVGSDFRYRQGNSQVRKSAWWWMQSGSNQSPSDKFCYNRENYRQFRIDNPSSPDFTVNPQADSSACTQVPFAKEQGDWEG